MAELTRFEVVDMPAFILVGKDIRYNMDAHMKGDNRMGAFWDTCFGEGVFAPLEAQGTCRDDAYAGVMHRWDEGDGDFTYTIGMLMKPGSTVPEGYTCYPWAAQRVAISWIRGKDTVDVCSQAHELTLQRVKESGHSADGMRWCMEYYTCPRFTELDEDGMITLDYYVPLDD